MRVLGDFAKIAITWSFGHFWSRCSRKNLLQSWCYKCILIRVECNLRQSAFGPFKRGLVFGRFLKNFPWSPLCTFSENAGFGWPCESCHNLAIRVLLEPLSSLCTLSAYYLEDNVISARVLLRILSEGSFLGDFWKTSLGRPFALFQKMRLLGDLAIIAITCPFGLFWSRCLRQNHLPSLHFNCIIIRV